MKIYLSLVDKEIEIEGSAKEVQIAIDIIQDRFLDFSPRILNQRTASPTPAEIFKKLLEGK